jgi:hypothetical protein
MNTDKVILKTLHALSEERLLFHSEADFQHAFAWELQKAFPDLSIRLEYKPQLLGYRLHVDVWATRLRKIIAVELKYKTRALRVSGDELFHLLNQSAQDIARYDFLKDIARLEAITSAYENAVGYAILLTNDSSYWNTSKNSSTVDVNFRIQEGRIISGLLGWGGRASEGTTRGRIMPIEIKGRYMLQWHDYSTPSTDRYGKFRYVLVKVCRSSGSRIVER